MLFRSSRSRLPSGTWARESRSASGVYFTPDKSFIRNAVLDQPHFQHKSDFSLPLNSLSFLSLQPKRILHPRILLKTATPYTIHKFIFTKNGPTRYGGILPPVARPHRPRIWKFSIPAPKKPLPQPSAHYKREEFGPKNTEKRGEYGMSPVPTQLKTVNPLRKAGRNNSRPSRNCWGTLIPTNLHS
jgi:hypothetical protein